MRQLNPGPPQGRDPHWVVVVFWLVLYGGAITAMALAVPTDTAGRVFLVGLSVALLVWVIAPAVRRRRRDSP